jgi:hypothetical protein
MPHGLRQDRLREQRNVFLLFLGAVFISLMTALPIVTASIPTSRVVVPAQFRYATFEDLDRNHDGFVDGAEAAALPGLAGVLERADRNGDGRLDKVEFAKALAMMEGGTRL